VSPDGKYFATGSYHNYLHVSLNFRTFYQISEGLMPMKNTGLIPDEEQRARRPMKNQIHSFPKSQRATFREVA